MAPKLSTLRPLIAGDVIIDAKPVVYVVSSEMKSNNCDNCLTKWNQLKKCSKCLKMYYCGKYCQQKDWKYHKNECKVFSHKRFKLKKSSDDERLLIRLLLAMKSNDKIATKRYQLFDGSDVSLNDIEVDSIELSSNAYQMNRLHEIVKHLKAYEFEFHFEELFRWFGTIVCSPIVLYMTSFTEKVSVPPEVSLRGGMNPKDLQSLNRYEPTPNVGRGLFPQFWSVRHSCLPNATVIPNGLSVQLKALKPMSVGTKITRSYIDLAQNKIDRQIALKFGHSIERCDCLKCKLSLDSDIDYENYNQLAHNLRAFKSEIEIEVQQLVHKPKRYELKDYIPLFETLKAIEKRVFGEFTLAFSETLLMARLIARFCNESCDKPWNDSIEQQLEDNFRMTFGAEHPTYQKYSRESNGTELAKAGRMFRQKMRKENNLI